MGLDYDPKDAVLCWPEADYEGVLLKVDETKSKIKPDGSGGNPMEVWTIRLFNPDGREQQTTDYVVIPGATFKIKQLARALGKEDDFNNRRFHAGEHIGASFLCETVIESSAGFDDKNKVKKYKPLGQAAPQATQQYPRNRESIRRENAPAVTAPIGDKEFEEDDIPF